MNLSSPAANTPERSRLALVAAPAGMHARSVQRADLPALLSLCEEHAAQSAFERLPYGHARDGLLELQEALFEPPLRAGEALQDIKAGGTD